MLLEIPWYAVHNLMDKEFLPPTASRIIPTVRRACLQWLKNSLILGESPFGQPGGATEGSTCKRVQNRNLQITSQTLYMPYWSCEEICIIKQASMLKLKQSACCWNMLMLQFIKTTSMLTDSRSLGTMCSDKRISDIMWLHHTIDTQKESFKSSQYEKNSDDCAHLLHDCSICDCKGFLPIHTVIIVSTQWRTSPIK